MQASELDRISFLTRHFNQLQGLRCTVPVGLILMATGVPHLAGRTELAISLQVLSLCVMGLVLYWQFRYARPYYAARVGVVNPLDRRAGPAQQLAVANPVGSPLQSPVTQRQLIPIGVGLVLGLFIALAAIFPPAVLSNHKLAMASGLYLLAAAAFLGNWWIERDHRPDQAHVALAGTILLTIACSGGGLHLLDPDTWMAFYKTASVYGALAVLCGLIDHRQLIRAFHRPAESSAAASPDVAAQGDDSVCRSSVSTAGDAPADARLAAQRFGQAG